MRILVYGAGVIGCELAHELCKGENEVTLLARGSWKNTIDKKGLVIRHYAQLKTTQDKIKTVSRLDPEDLYDLIFVVMQYSQLRQVLLPVANNCSRHIIFVGNNMDAIRCEKTVVENSPVMKEVAFAFLGAGGSRENGRVVSVHKRVSMTIGGATNPMSKEFQRIVKTTFEKCEVRLTKEPQMDGWLKCHAAFILPLCYICYALNGNLKHITREQMSKVFDATIEAHEALKKLGVPIRPDGEEEYFYHGRKGKEFMLYLMAKTPIGRLAVSDHAMHAVFEFKTIDKEFCKIQKQSGVPMPVWKKLRSAGRDDWAC